ncbi:MAG: hypothetical protein OEZ39_11950 [Gammaproteobacteria bacterium]|nr:hypothetical protein [Gammaproteobacteria bacterium]MDH5652556.1 hypothetical protein [Gammaproteobacteria bacterium]
MPGQYYIYIPYADGESNSQLAEAAKEWRRNASQHFQSPSSRRKIPKILVHGTGSPLSELRNSDPECYTVYIMAHCNIGRKTINNINIFARERIEITAPILATRMISDGLPKNVKNLKLFACHGGTPQNTEKYTALDSFVARLYFSLVSRGVEKVILSAYTEALTAATVASIGDGHKRTQSGDRPSSHRRQWPECIPIRPMPLFD